MNKVKNAYLLFALVLLSSKVVNSQVICSPDKIYGDWHYITAFHPVSRINVDSLKNTVKDSSQYRYKVSYLENGNCITQISNEKNRTLVYRIDPSECKIIFGKRKKPKYYEFSIIEYVDENCLFYTKWNPHGPWTHFLYRK